MGNFEEKKKKIDEILDGYEPDMQVVARAIEKIEEIKAKEKRRKKVIITLSTLAACICFICVGLLYYFNNLPQTPKYFDDTTYHYSSTVTDTDIESHLTQSGIEKYFVGEAVTNQLAVTVEDEKVCFLNQSFFDVEGESFVELSIVIMKNATFDFEKDFMICNEIKTIYNIFVKYVVVGSEVKAKFAYDSHNYFLKITTYGSDAVGRLDYYITQLLSD